MYCVHCGAQLQPFARFCQRCGAVTAPSSVPGSAGSVPSPMAMGGEYAGFWLRLAAYLIDGVMLNIVTSITYLIFGVSDYLEVNRAPDGSFESFSFNGAEFTVAMLLGFGISATYSIVCTSRWGQTVGKKAVGIKVVDARGHLLSPRAAAIRWIGYLVSIIILFIGYLMVAWDPRKQGLHDKMAGSFVVKVRTTGGF